MFHLVSYLYYERIFLYKTITQRNNRFTSPPTIHPTTTNPNDNPSSTPPPITHASAALSDRSRDIGNTACLCVSLGARERDFSAVSIRGSGKGGVVQAVVVAAYSVPRESDASFRCLVNRRDGCCFRAFSDG